MTHLSLSQMADYARGLRGPDDEMVTAHVASGCSPCRRMLGALRRVWSVGQMPHQDPPADVVERAIAIYSARATARLLSRPPTRARLRLAPAMAGIRALRAIIADSGHAMFETNQMTIHVRVDQEADGALTLSGQLCARGMEQAPKGVLVLVTEAGTAIAHTLTGASGEFQLEFHRAARLQLSVRPAGGERVDCVLDSLMRIRPIKEISMRSK